MQWEEYNKNNNNNKKKTLMNCKQTRKNLKSKNN